MNQPSSLFSPAHVSKLTASLEDLGAAHAGIKLAVLTSEDGFEVASYRASGTAGRIAAMSSSLQALAQAIAQEAGLLGCRSLVIEAGTGNVVLVGVEATSPRITLAIVASGSETLGTVLWATRNCCRQIEQVVKG